VTLLDAYTMALRLLLVVALLGLVSSRNLGQ
jgi:hypothetical protein